MHVLGHVLIWLIAVGALAATVLSAKTYEVRNSWIKKVDQLKKEVEQDKPVLAEKKARLRELREEFDRTILGWERPFVNVDGQLNAAGLRTQNPSLAGWLASLDPAKQAAQVVYVFQPQADGSSLYIGSFQFKPPVQAGGIADFIPTWTVRPEDGAAIQNQNGPFRVRPMVPSYFTTKYAAVRGEMTVTERILADKQEDLAEQKLRQADAKSIRDKRNDQLQGPNGVVSQLQTSEDARNIELDELDYWRRKVDDDQKTIKELLKESHELEQQLKTSSPSNPPPVTTQVTTR